LVEPRSRNARFAGAHAACGNFDSANRARGHREQEPTAALQGIGSYNLLRGLSHLHRDRTRTNRPPMGRRARRSSLVDTFHLHCRAACMRDHRGRSSTSRGILLPHLLALDARTYTTRRSRRLRRYPRLRLGPSTHKYTPTPTACPAKSKRPLPLSPPTSRTTRRTTSLQQASSCARLVQRRCLLQRRHRKGLPTPESRHRCRVDRSQRLCSLFPTSRQTQSRRLRGEARPRLGGLAAQ
jgi:hypothetical protein